MDIKGSRWRPWNGGGEVPWGGKERETLAVVALATPSRLKPKT